MQTVLTSENVFEDGRIKTNKASTASRGAQGCKMVHPATVINFSKHFKMWGERTHASKESGIRELVLEADEASNSVLPYLLD